MANSIGKVLKRAALVLLVVMLAGILCFASYFIGGLSATMDDPYKNNDKRARYALERTNLPEDYTLSFVISGDCGWRDYYVRTEFVIAYDADEMLSLMGRTEGWTVEPITAQDYRDFVKATWYPEMEANMVADDMVFDAWFYRTTTPSAGYERMMTGYFSFMGRADRGFEFAVFDKETGIFIFIDQFG